MSTVARATRDVKGGVADVLTGVLQRLFTLQRYWQDSDFDGQQDALREREDFRAPGKQNMASDGIWPWSLS